MAEKHAVQGNIRFSTAAGEWVVDIASIKNTVAFERHFDISAQVLQLSPRLEYVAFMAWSAARAGELPVADTFDGFLDEVVELEVVEGEEDRDSNPTDGDQEAAP